MEDSEEAISYGYKVNVKDRVNRFEAKTKYPKQNEASNAKTPQKSPRKEKVTDPNINVSAAVVEVESLQFDSPNVQSNTKSSSIPTILSPEAEKDVEDEPQMGVKNILRRLSNGMIHPFRNKVKSQEEEGVTKPQLDVIDLDSVPTKEVTNRNFKSFDEPPKTTFTVKRLVKANNQSSASELETAVSGSSLFSKLVRKNNSNNAIVKQEVEVETIQQLQPKLEDYKIRRKVESEIKIEDKLETYKDNPIQSKDEEEIKTEVSEESQIESPKPKPRRRYSFSIEDESGESSVEDKESIIVMGYARGGKSSIANFLLRQDLSPVYRSIPLEREIIACTAKLKQSSKLLELIDTPGFNNDKLDASILHSLSTHLDSTPSKKLLDHIQPQLLLIVIRVEDDGAVYEKEECTSFLKGFAHYHENLLAGGPQLLFVITHAHSLDVLSLRAAGDSVLSLVKQTLHLSSYNLCFHKVGKGAGQRSLTTSYLDLLTALQAQCPLFNPKSFSEVFISKRIPLASVEHPEVSKLFKVLSNAYKNVRIEPTEISTLLEVGWENVDKSLRKKYPSTLLTLQQVFQRLKLKNFAQLPEAPLEIFKLLKAIPQHNPVTTDLLKETLQIELPPCHSSLYIGQGYNVGKDAVSHSSPFKLSGSLKTSPLGLIPVEMTCKLESDREIIFNFYPSLEEYVLDRFKDLGIKNASVPKSVPHVSNQRLGYNLVRPGIEPGKATTAGAVVEYRIFQLSLSPRGEELEFKEQFWETLESLPEVDGRNLEIVDAWGEFFNYWGTHIVKAAYGGGSIQVCFRGKVLSKIYKSVAAKSSLPSDEYETSKVFQWITGDGLDFARFQVPMNPEEFLKDCGDNSVDTRFNGGDIRFQQIDLIKTPNDKVTSLREEWISSLPLNPVILESNLVLIPISQFVRAKSEGLAMKMDIAFSHFYKNFMIFQGKQSSCSIL